MAVWYPTQDGDGLEEVAVATDLPGVRQPVTVTGMGEIVAIADPASLAEGIVKVLENRNAYLRTRAEIEALFDLDVTVAAYERLFCP